MISRWPSSSIPRKQQSVHKLPAKPSPEQALVRAVQRVERPMTRRVVGGPSALQLEQMAANGFAEGSCKLCGYGVCACCPACERPQRGGMGTCRCRRQSAGHTVTGNAIKSASCTLCLTSAHSTDACPYMRSPMLAAPQHAWLRVGMRVRVIDDGGGEFLTNGREHVVTGHYPGLTSESLSVSGVPGYHWARRFEPIPEPAPVAEQAGEWSPPAPFEETPPRQHGQARRWKTSAGDVVAIMHDGRLAHYKDARPLYHPSLALACCAALSIELRPLVGGRYSANTAEGARLATMDGAESCARAALAAFHARGRAV